MSAEHVASDILALACGEVEVRPSGDGVALTSGTGMGLALSVELTPGQAQRLARALCRASRFTLSGEVG